MSRTTLKEVELLESVSRFHLERRPSTICSCRLLLRSLLHLGTEASSESTAGDQLIRLLLDKPLGPQNVDRVGLAAKFYVDNSRMVLLLESCWKSPGVQEEDSWDCASCRFRWRMPQRIFLLWFDLTCCSRFLLSPSCDATFQAASAGWKRSLICFLAVTHEATLGFNQDCRRHPRIQSEYRVVATLCSHFIREQCRREGHQQPCLG